MKKLILYSVILMGLLVILVNCATKDEPPVEIESQELYGVWLNPDYQNNSSYNEKLVFYENGVLLGYLRASNEKPFLIHAYDALDKWSDEQGNTYFKLKVKTQDYGSKYMLIRISNSGKSLESSFGVMNFPEEIDPTNEGQYRGIYTKQ